MADIMAIGMSGLQAYEYALSITSQNIANSNTPNYSRKQIEFASALFGNGVNIADVRRVFDTAANQNLQTANSTYAYANVSTNLFSNYEPILDDNNINITKYLTDANNSIQQLTANPSSIQLRSDYMSRISSLVTQFNTTAGYIQQQQQSVNLNIQTDANSVNQILQQLSSINGSIVSLSADDQLDLLDNRDQLLQQLAGYINYSASTDSFNSLTIQLGNGTPILQGTTVSQLITTPSPTNSSLLQICLQNSAGNSPITSLITNGEIAGLLNFQNNGLQCSLNGLGRLALAIADQFNTQNQLGMDLNGNLGVDIFTDVNSASNLIDRVLGNVNNQSTATMQVSIDDITQLTVSDYTFTVSSANSYSLVRNSDGQSMSSGAIGSLPQSISVDGYTLNLTGGSFSVGDMYTISPTHNAATNLGMNITLPQQLALASPVDASANLNNQGSGVISVSSITDTTNASFTVPQQLNPPIQIQFISPTSYQLMNANTGSLIEGPLSYNPLSGAALFPTENGFDPGYRISLNGSINAGDVFNVNYNTNGSGDNRNAVNLANLFQAPLLQSGTLTMSQAYNLMSSDISIKTNSANIACDSAQVLKDQAQSNRDQVSAVSLEEESANLARYQQAYQANAQIMQVAKTVFETIINVTRG